MIEPAVLMDVDVEPSPAVVMIVDDEPDTVYLLKQVLRGSGFDVMGATSGDEALDKIARITPDLVLLDIMMPVMDGWETYERMHAMLEVPVIVISARGSKQDVVDGLTRGAEDYIIKPFYNEEVVQRVKTVLSRTGKQPEVNQLVFTRTGLRVNLITRQVWLANEEISLKPKEFDFISLLARKSPEVVTYQEISLVLWRKAYSNLIRKYINHVAFTVRNKFKEILPEENLIINFAGWGYKLLAEREVARDDRQS